VHGQLKPTTKRRLVNDRNRRNTQGWDCCECVRSSLKVRVEASVIKRIDLRKISASHKDAGTRGGKYQPSAALARDLGACVCNGTDQPRVQYHNTATWLCWIWLKPQCDNAIRITIYSKGGWHSVKGTEIMPVWHRDAAA
jgi:hypothetical protein